MKRWLLLFLIPGIISSFSGGHREKVSVLISEPVSKQFIFTSTTEKWADSVLSTLTLDEKIGQLFMVSAHPEKDQKHYKEVAELVSKYKVGGVIFFKSGPVRLVNMSNYLQSLTEVPLLVSIDGEWGLSMRVDSTMRFPLQMQLGALPDDELIYKMGKAIGRQMQRLGIQINFAPVLDVNNNPLNPVINMRSFGDNKKMVAEKAYQYMLGQQEMHVLAVGKHFPGHGDTKTDSHSDLPFIGFSKKRLDSLELYPFRKLIPQGIGGMMVAHLDVPALDPVNKRPTSLSPEVVNDLLRNKMGFDGLIFTDGLNMKGVTKYFKPGEAALKALLAGNDILLCPEDVPWGIRLIKEAIEDDIICEQEIDAHVRRILQVKKWSGLDNCQYVDTANLSNDLFTPEDELINRQLSENSLTLVRNENNIIPFGRLDTLRIASVFFGKTEKNVFQENLGLYAPVAEFNIEKDLKSGELSRLKDSLRKFNLIIVSLKQTNRYSYRTFNFTDQSLDILKYLSDSNNVVLNLFASPYSLSRIPFYKKVKAILIGYDDTYYPAVVAPQILFGAVSAKGHLPVNVSSAFPYNFGIETGKPIRIKYSVPEELGIHSSKLNRIDSIVNDAISRKAMPGCQVLVAKEGVVIYRKSFGYFSFDKNRPVTNNDLYDLASITKTMATTLIAMNMYETDKLDLDKELVNYLPEIKGTNKENILIKDMLTHQARLMAWIPYYLELSKDEAVRKEYFSKTPVKNKTVQVADSFYVINSYRDSIYQKIYRSKLSSVKEYKYSDLGFYLLQAVIEKTLGDKLENIADKLFYKSIGTTSLGFNPLKRFSIENIVPTENDTLFRKQVIRGFVHDQGAALMGGVAGHAGLFSNSNDLAKICQMLLWEGRYGGVRYFNNSTVNTFTECQFCPKNRRGLGFDKPEPDSKKDSPVSKEASLRTFGHQGFTGTCYWVDPEKNLIYIFLSNRVYPDAENKKFSSLGVRNKVLDVIYEAIEEK